MAREWQAPGGPYVLEDGTDEYQLPGGPYLLEDQAAAAAATSSSLIRLRRPYTQKPPTGVAPNLGHPQLKNCRRWLPALEGGGRGISEVTVTRDVIGNVHGLFNSDTAGTVPQWQPSKMGWSIQAHGGNNDQAGIRLANMKQYDGAGGVDSCYSLWMRTNELLTSLARILTKWNNSFGEHFIGTNSGDKKLVVYDGAYRVLTATEDWITQGEWTHIFIRCNGTTAYTAWVNGIEQLTESTVTGVAWLDTGEMQGLGGRYNGAVLDFSWADFRIYAPFPGEGVVRSIYQNPWAPFQRQIYIPQAAAAATTTWFLPLWRPMTSKPTGPVA